MTTAEWLEKVLADRPPLTPAQVAALRPVFAPVIPHMQTPPAATRGALRHESPTPEKEHHVPR